jgi:teichoic acid transport system ATP-binding protein
MTTPLVEANGLGVSFVTGPRRDDLQTFTYKALSGRWRRAPFWALRDVTFSAGAGQILGLIGRNGAGKTTLCRALAGLIKPDAGTIAVRGEVSSLLSLGTGFDLDLSGRENILLNGMMLGLSRRAVEALVPQIVAFSGVGRFIDQPLKSYSAGMKSRLGFGIGAELEPDILVLDETLSVGDIDFTARAGERLQALMRRARLVILVSHQLDFVTKYCTHALWLDAGGVRARGTAEEIVRQYHDATPKIARSRVTSGLSRSERPPTGGRAITVNDVSVTFDLARRQSAQGRGAEAGPRGPLQLRALEAVSFSVDEGEVVGVIGPNGAGKTTLCRVLAGVLKPDGGAVHIARSVTALLTLGAGLNHQLSGADNIYLIGMILGMPRRRVRQLFGEIVAFSELGSFIDEPVKHYSSGMRARLAFSTVTTIKPDILLIDEALSVGDAAFSRKAAARIRDLIDDAVAVVVVTHNLTFVENVCTRAIWLQEGRVVFDGAPDEAVQRYRLAGGGTGKRSRAGGARADGARSTS